MNRINWCLTVLLVTVLAMGATSQHDAKATVPTCASEACGANDCYGGDYICIKVWCGAGTGGWVTCRTGDHN